MPRGKPILSEETKARSEFHYSLEGGEQGGKERKEGKRGLNREKVPGGGGWPSILINACKNSY